MRFIMSSIFCVEQRLPICLHISRKNLGQMVLCKQFKWTSFAVQHLHQACQWEQTSTRWHKSEMSPFCKPATFFSFRLSVPLELPSISSWILYRERASVVLEYRMAGSFEKLTTWRPHDKKKTHCGTSPQWPQSLLAALGLMGADCECWQLPWWSQRLNDDIHQALSRLTHWTWDFG